MGALCNMHPDVTPCTTRLLGSVARHTQLSETETLIMGRAGKLLFLGYLEFIVIFSGLMGVDAHAFKKHAFVLIISICPWDL